MTDLSKNRMDPSTQNEVFKWLDQFEHFISYKKIPLSAFVNFDETRIVLGQNGILHVKHLVSKKKKKAQYRSPKKFTHCGTYLPFVSSSGDILASYFIFSLKFNENGEGKVAVDLPSSFSRTRKGMSAPHIFYNDTGYLNGEIWSQILDHFCGVWNIRYPGVVCCCFGDNLSVHREPVVVQKAILKGVYLSYFVRNTTHWSQPLDNLLFACLKQEIAKEV